MPSILILGGEQVAKLNINAVFLSTPAVSELHNLVLAINLCLL